MPVPEDSEKGLLQKVLGSPAIARPAREERQERVEQVTAARQAGLVVRAAEPDPEHGGGDARDLGPAELCVLEIDVVNDLGDGLEPRRPEAQPPAQDLERAGVPLVRELRLEHVETQLAGLGDVALRGHELEARRRVDEAAHEPRAGDAIHRDPRPGDPGAADEVRSRGRGAARLGRRRRRAGPQRRDETARRLAPRGAEVVDGRDLLQAALEPRDVALERAPRVLAERPPTEPPGDGPRLLGERVVVRVARAAEERLDLGVRETVDELRFEDRRVAAARHHLAPDPLKVLLGDVAPGQHVDGVLEGHRPDTREAPPDLHPQVVRLGRDLVDQHQPTIGHREGEATVESSMSLLIYSRVGECPRTAGT